MSWIGGQSPHRCFNTVLKRVSSADFGIGDWSAHCRSEFSSPEMPAQSRISLQGHGIVSDSVRFYWIAGCDSFLILDLNFELSSLLSLFAFDVGFNGRKRVTWMLRRRSETVSSLWNLPLQLPLSSLTLVSWCWCRCSVLRFSLFDHLRSFFEIFNRSLFRSELHIFFLKGVW